MQRGLSRSCRLSAHSWSWSEINWHNLNIWRWCQKEEQKTCEIAKSKYDVKLSAGILQLERFDFSFTAWLLHFAAIQASIYSFWDLLLSQQLCGFLQPGEVWYLLCVTIKGSSYCCAASSIRLTKQHCHNCKKYWYWCRVLEKEQKRRSFFWIRFLGVISLKEIL